MYGSADPALTRPRVLAGALWAGDTSSAPRAGGRQAVGELHDHAGRLHAPAGNYDLTVNPGKLTITKKAASVTAEDKSKVYGSADPALTTTDSGFLAADLGRRQDHLQRLARCRRVGRRRPVHDHPGRLGRGEQPARQLRPHLQHRPADDHQEGDHGEPRRQDEGVRRRTPALTTRAATLPGRRSRRRQDQPSAARRVRDEERRHRQEVTLTGADAGRAPTRQLHLSRSRPRQLTITKKAIT